MIRVNQVKLPVSHSEADLRKKTAKMMGVSADQIQSVELVRQSLDARKKPDLYYLYALDVMAEEAGTKRRFNVEMQVKTETVLAKRSRYYHAQMDMDALLTGETYDQLPDTYVIFICDFVPFDSRLYRYNIRNVVRETNELLK